MSQNPPLRVLSFQSDVVAGHVGHAAARVAYQALHIELLALPTVLYSNHPGHGGFRGRVTPSEELAALMQGLAERGLLEKLAGVQSGYLGEPGHAEIVRDAVSEVKRRNAAARYLLDPVFGDDGGAYARPGVAEAMSKHLLPLADIVTPNRFELASLTSRRIESAADAASAARQLGRPMVVATSIPFPPNLGVIVVQPHVAVTVAHGPKLDHVASGAGDIFAALFFGRLLRGEPASQAMIAAVRSVHAIIGAAAGDGSKDLPLIAFSDWLAEPPDGAAVVSATL